MSSFNQNAIQHKTILLNLAAELGNVSKACKLMGFSRDTFYRYQKAIAEGGVEALAEEGIILTEAQVQALERKEADDEACGEIETHHPGYLGTQDIFHGGTIKGVGRIYQQAYVDAWLKWAAAKLHTTKTPITAADMLNDRVLPIFVEKEKGVIHMLTDRGTEYCGKVETHDYELYLGINDIEHTKTKARHPQATGICERFHKAILQKFYQPAFSRKLYSSLEELQSDLDAWLERCNNERTNQGKICWGEPQCKPCLRENHSGRRKSDS